MEDDARRILDFLTLSERLKLELRHSWLSNGGSRSRWESVAEHSWHMALMAVLMHRHLREPVDVGKTLKMVLVHDLSSRPRPATCRTSGAGRDRDHPASAGRPRRPGAVRAVARVRGAGHARGPHRGRARPPGGPGAAQPRRRRDLGVGRVRPGLHQDGPALRLGSVALSEVS